MNVNKTPGYLQGQSFFKEALDKHAIVSIADVSGNITYVNDKFCQISKYARDELLGQSHRQLKSGTHDAKFFDDMWLTISSGRTWQGEICNRNKDGGLYWVETTIVPSLDENGLPYQYVSMRIEITKLKQVEAGLAKSKAELEVRVQERTAEIEFKNTMLQTQQETSLDAILVVDGASCIISYNQQFTDLWRVSPQIISARLDAPVLQSVVEQVENPEAFLARVQYLYEHHDVKSREEVKLKDGRIIDRYSAPITGEGGKYYGRVWYFSDITESKRVEEVLQQEKFEQHKLIIQLQDAQSHLLQSEKMASIGQLAAGVAHEINNPIGYVYSNLGTLEKYVQHAFAMLDQYEQAEEAITDAGVREKLKASRDKLDIAFLKEDLRDLMNESKDGITRVKKIVENLKDFSHVDASDEWHFTYLHSGIDSTLNIVSNEIKYKADVIKEYGELPEVECLPSQLNQVFMNLLVNAGHAIEERGTITIRTGCQGDEVWVEVADTGKGIELEHLKKIFDPFFTTKPVGKGTGLGLSLSFGIIQKHHGRIEVQSEVGHGTTFRVWLPISQPQDELA